MSSGNTNNATSPVAPLSGGQLTALAGTVSVMGMQVSKRNLFIIVALVLAYVAYTYWKKKQSPQVEEEEEEYDDQYPPYGMNPMGPNGMPPMGPNGMPHMGPNGMHPMGPSGMQMGQGLPPHQMNPNHMPPMQYHQADPQQPPQMMGPSMQSGVMNSSSTPVTDAAAGSPQGMGQMQGINVPQYGVPNMDPNVMNSTHTPAEQGLPEQ